MSNVQRFLANQDDGAILTLQRESFPIETDEVIAQNIVIQNNVDNEVQLGIVQDAIYASTSYSLLFPAVVGESGEFLKLIDANTGELGFSAQVSANDNTISFSTDTNIVITPNSFTTNSASNVPISVTLAPQPNVIAGTYPSANVTVNAEGIITAVSAGSGAASSSLSNLTSKLEILADSDLLSYVAGSLALTVSASATTSANPVVAPALHGGDDASNADAAIPLHLKAASSTVPLARLEAADAVLSVVSSAGEARVHFESLTHAPLCGMAVGFGNSRNFEIASAHAHAGFSASDLKTAAGAAVSTASMLSFEPQNSHASSALTGTTTFTAGSKSVTGTQFQTDGVVDGALLETPAGVRYTVHTVSNENTLTLREDALATEVGAATVHQIQKRIVASPLFVMQGGAQLVDGGLPASRPAVGTSGAAASYEIRSHASASNSDDDGFMRIQAGGGSTAASAAYIDLCGTRAASDMSNSVRVGAGGVNLTLTSTALVPSTTLDLGSASNTFGALHASSLNSTNYAFVDDGTSQLKLDLAAGYDYLIDGEADLKFQTGTSSVSVVHDGAITLTTAGAVAAVVDNTGLTMSANHGLVLKGTNKDTKFASANDVCGVLHGGVTQVEVGDAGLRIPGGRKIQLYEGSAGTAGAASGNVGLEIIYENANSVVRDVGVGQMLLRSNGAGVYIQNSSGVNMAQFDCSTASQEAVRLYFNNLFKLETSAAGVDITGSLTATAGLVAGGVVSGVSTPVVATDAATKAYVDQFLAGLSFVAAVDVVETSTNLPVATSGTPSQVTTIDGVDVHSLGKPIVRILLLNQSTASENGVWSYDTTSFLWSRPADFAAGTGAANKSLYVDGGSTNAGKGYVCTSANTADTIDTSNLAFVEFASSAFNVDATSLVNNATVIGLAPTVTSVHSFSNTLTASKTSGTGLSVTSDAVVSGAIKCDTITETTAAAGVTVEGVLARDGGVFINQSTGLLSVGGLGEYKVSVSSNDVFVDYNQAGNVASHRLYCDTLDFLDFSASGGGATLLKLTNAASGGYCSLYSGNSERLRTTSSGLEVFVGQAAGEINLSNSLTSASSAECSITYTPTVSGGPLHTCVKQTGTLAMASKQNKYSLYLGYDNSKASTPGTGTGFVEAFHARLYTKTSTSAADLTVQFGGMTSTFAISDGKPQFMRSSNGAYTEFDMSAQEDTYTLLMPAAAPAATGNVLSVTNISGSTSTLSWSAPILSSGTSITGGGEALRLDGEMGATVTAGSFTVGKVYRILTTGTTVFTGIGAINSTPGTWFTATGAGSGTGTAELSNDNYVSWYSGGVRQAYIGYPTEGSASFEINLNQGLGMTSDMTVVSPGSGVNIDFYSQPAVNNGGGHGQLMRLRYTGDGTTVVADTGGTLAFGGLVDTVGNLGYHATIGGFKRNATPSNYEGYLTVCINNSSGTMTEKMRVTDTGLDVSGHISASGNATIGGSVSGKRLIVGTKANGATMTAAESGCVVFQSTNGATITLPATAAGLTYTFIWNGVVGQTFNISPNASDRISGTLRKLNGTVVLASNNGVGADDKDLQLTSGTVGDRVTLVADGTTGWFIMDGVGEWAFEA